MRTILQPRIIRLLLTVLMLTPAPLLAADAGRTVTKEQNSRELSLKVGDTFRLELPSRGGTGYLWAVEANGAPYLQLLSETTQKVGESRPGSPLLQVWQFKAAKAGVTEIKLAYYRPWEGAGKAADHFRLKLRIE